MNKIAALAFTLACAGLALLAGCAAKPIHSGTVEERPPVPDPEFAADTIVLRDESYRISPIAFDYYINGTIYEAIGNPYRAAEQYRKALKFYPDSYRIRFALAENLYNMQRIQDALSILKPIDPEDAAVWELRGDLCRATGNLDEARRAYREALKQDSTLVELYSFLGSLYSREGDVDSTAWAFENIGRLNPQNYIVWFELGRLQLREGRLDQARESFARSAEIRSDSINIMAVIGLGEVLEAQGKLDSALAVFKQALEADSNNIQVHRNLAGVYVKLDSLGQAARHARIESRLAPLDRYSSRRLGMLYFFMDSLEQADSVFTYLVESGERNPVNHQYLGRIALQRDDPERALHEFSQVVQMADSAWENWIDLAGVYRTMQRRDDEIATYRRGLNHVRLPGGKERLMFALGVALEQTGRLDESVDTFTQLLELNPDADGALNYLGYTLADRGERLPYARELIGRALEIDPDNAAYLDSYGWVYYKLGDYEKALQYLKRAVELDSDPVMFDHLGDTYQALGNLEEAQRWWQKALELDPENETYQSKVGP